MKNAPAPEKNFDEKILQLAATLDKFEGYANPHSSRIATLAEAVAQKFRLAPFDLSILRQTALVHDVGEFVMNRDYLKLNRSLSDEERIDMQRHPVIGEQESAKRGFPRGVQLLVRWHHEWWNGAGYPDGLQRQQIPLAARILRVVDTYCASTDTRPHRAALSASAARQRLINWAGIEFDPQIVKYFLELENVAELKSFHTSEIYV